MKRGNELNNIKILWTNLCIMIKVIFVNNVNIDVNNYLESDFNILGLALNMCILLAVKRDLAVVYFNINEETTKL